MARPDEAPGAGDREAHRVLVAIADPLRPGRSGRRAEEAGVRRDEERAIRRIDPEAVHVHRTGILLLARSTLERRFLGPAAAGERNHDQQGRATSHRGSAPTWPRVTAAGLAQPQSASA